MQGLGGMLKLKDMINAEELRLNNYISTENGSIHPVWEISDDHINCYGDDFGPRLEDIYPIRLTPQIVDICGFNEGDDNIFGKLWYSQIDNHTSIKINFKEKDISCYLSIGKNKIYLDCKYLHQLQNLYYVITGSELYVQDEGLKKCFIK